MKILNRILFITLLLCVFVAGSSAGAEGLSATAPTVGFIFTRDLTIGVHGNDVSTLQQFLIAGGFLKILTPTGYFGSLTKAALGVWQASVGVYPSVGFFGSISRGRINTTIGQKQTNMISLPNTIGATTAPTTGEATNPIITNNRNGSPVRLIIPKLNIDAGFQYTGITPDGVMEIPTNIVDVGWFTGSARPGEKGVAIITGHVAQIRGGILTKPGVFKDLDTLSVGDKLYVLNDKGESIAFVVRETRNYDPAADATDVFTSSDSGIHLNLITCEGTWNPTQLSYSQRLVVFTDVAQ